MAITTARAVAPVAAMPAESGPLSLAAALEQMRAALVDGELDGLLAANERLRTAIDLQRRQPGPLAPQLRGELRLCSELLLRANARNQRALRVYFSPAEGYGPDGAAHAPTRL